MCREEESKKKKATASLTFLHRLNLLSSFTLLLYSRLYAGMSNVNYSFIHSGFHGCVTKSCNDRTEGSLVPARAQRGELLFFFFFSTFAQKN